MTCSITKHKSTNWSKNAHLEVHIHLIRTKHFYPVTTDSQVFEIIFIHLATEVYDADLHGNKNS